jgi:tRNA dimethylallyltransferase
MKKIIVIAGPTASGKTSLAINLAKEIDGEVINADSLQVYKENPIISAQPTILEQQNVPHHLFGYVSGDEEYTVARWIRDAKNKINNIEKTPIIVGGSGFYLKHLIFGLSAVPEIPNEIRLSARNLHNEIGNNAFHALLEEIDKVSADKLSSNDAIRMLRAYEVVKATGKPLSCWQENNIKHFPVSSFSLIILDPPRKLLYENCNQRFLNMLNAGAMEEVRYLNSKGYNPSSGVMKSHGVPEIIGYLNGDLSLDMAILKSQQVVRNYAKRQTTWFKHQFKSSELDVHFVSQPEEEFASIVNFLKISSEYAILNEIN